MKVTRHRRHDATAIREVPATARRRYDRFDLTPPEKRRDGGMMVEGRIARPAVYDYQNDDGTIRRELVPTSTLCDPEWLEDVAHGPVTYPHPPTGTMVTPDNYEQYVVGHADGEPDISELTELDSDGKLVLKRKGGYVKIKMAIGKRSGLNAIQNHDAAQLSPGYDVDCVEVADGSAAKWLKANGRGDETPGIDPDHGNYDAIQIKRYGNHTAIVPAARGGAGCQLRADGNALIPGDVTMDPKLLAALLAIPGMTRADAEGIAKAASTDAAPLLMKHLAEAHGALAAEQAAHAATTKTKDEMTAACDKMMAERKGMEVDVPPADKKMDAQGKEIVEPLRNLAVRYGTARAARVALAASHKVDVTDAMSISDIEKAVVAKVDLKAPTTEHPSYYRASCDRLDAVHQHTDVSGDAWGLPKRFQADQTRTDALPPAPTGDAWTNAILETRKGA